MKHLALILVICGYLAGCIEHRPKDGTTFDPQPKEEKTTTEKQPKGTRLYTGVIPCADCPGIDQRLVLKGDSSGIYRLTETFRQATEDGDEVLVSTGEWKRIRDTQNEKPVFYLSEGSIKDSSRITRYLVYDNKIVQMDIEGKIITNPAAYTLNLISKGTN